MKSISSNKFLRRGVAIYMAVILVFGNFPLTAFAEGLSVDLTVNGKGSLTLTDSSQSFTIALNSQNATRCEQTAPTDSGVTLSYSTEIAPGDAVYYPALGETKTFTVTCSDASGASVSDSVAVTLQNAIPTVDVVANGSNGPVTLTSGQTYVYAWNSTNATHCEQTSPTNSGVTLSGSSSEISSSDAVYYPTSGHPVTITVTCSNGSQAASDSVVINLESINTPTNPGTTTPVTVDVVANGSNGPVTLNSGETYVYSWNSTGATHCEQTSPTDSGVTLSGSSSTITSTDAVYYPTAGHPVTITITCSNATSSASDSVVINLASSTNPGSVTVDVVANGSNGPVTLTSGQTYVYAWNSTNATHCEQTSPTNSGVTLSGSSSEISSSDAVYYPTSGHPVTITVTCSNSTSSASDSVEINVAPTNPAVSVDVKANGSDGPLTLTSGQTYVYSWNSTNATHCELVSPTNSGLSLSGSSSVIDSTDTVYYPQNGSSRTITVTCSNSTSSATDSVVINAGSQSCPVSSITSALTLSVKNNESFSYTVTSSNNGSISVTNLPGGVSFATSTGIISGTITENGTYNITLKAENNCGSDTKTLVVSVSSDNNGGGGNGGGGNGGGSSRRHSHSRGSVRGEELACLYIKDYMRRDFVNDPVEVMKLQAFLIAMDGRTNVTVNGVFDQATFDAVSAFQMEYFSDILAPWGHTAPTGYVYILTLKKVNEIYCQHAFPLTEAQVNEIAAFRALIEGLRAQGYNVDGYYRSSGGSVGGAQDQNIDKDTDQNGTTTIDQPIVGKDNSKGQNFRNIAGAIFTLPNSWMEGFQCLYEFLLILIVLYVLANVIEDSLTKKAGADVEKKFRNKWYSIVGGLVLALILAYMFEELCLILPLIVALILSVIWIVIRPNHSSIKASVKSWNMVLQGRSKTIMNNAKNTAKSTIGSATTTAKNTISSATNSAKNTISDAASSAKQAIVKKEDNTSITTTEEKK